MAALQKLILAAVLGLTLVACGGGGGSGGNILTGGNAGGADDEPVLTATIVMTPREISWQTPAEVTITVLSGSTPVEDAAVSFDATIGTLTPNDGNLFTNEEGQATVTLTVPRTSETGTLSASATVDTETVNTAEITYIHRDFRTAYSDPGTS